MAVELERVGWEDGTLVSNAKVNVQGTIYEVEPEQYSGSTPLSAENLKAMEDNTEQALNDLNQDEYVPSGTGKGYSADFINKLTNGWTNYYYSGSAMTSSNGSVQTYSSVNIAVNDSGTLAYMTGTLYNNHSTTGVANVAFDSILRPATTKSSNNILTLFQNAVVGENTTIGTDGKITIEVYGTQNENSRHTIIPVWIALK